MHDDIPYEPLPLDLGTGKTQGRRCRVIHPFLLRCRDGYPVMRFAEWEAQCCGCICSVCELGHDWGVTLSQHHPDCQTNMLERHMNLRRWDRKRRTLAVA